MMIIIICILGLIIQKYVNNIKKINNEYKQYRQEYALAIEAMDGGIWKWDDKSEKVYVSNKIKELLGLEKERITLEQWYEYIVESDLKRVKSYFSIWYTCNIIIITHKVNFLFTIFFISNIHYHS